MPAIFRCRCDWIGMLDFERLATGMIVTTIPHSEFDDPDCCGCLNVIGRTRMFVEFVCNECGAVVACAGEEDMEAAIHVLELNCPVTTSVCPRCDFTNVIVAAENPQGRSE